MGARRSLTLSSVDRYAKLISNRERGAGPAYAFRCGDGAIASDKDTVG